MDFSSILVFLFLLVASFIGERGCDEVLGCGGFIRMKGATEKSSVDFSRIYVHLHSKQGSLKYKTDCAPNNGYYFIPVYETGEYVIKVVPPPGWQMEPKEIPLKFDGRTDPCSRNEDLNFHFSGFGITGYVISSGSNKGPSNISIDLLDASSNILETSKTVHGGKYSFPAVSPGKYTIKASSNLYKFEKISASIEVGVDNNVPQPMVISGYNIEGKVINHAKQPFSNIEMSIEDESKKIVMTATTNDDGVFMFESIKMGSSYTVRSAMEGLKTTPDALQVSINHGHVKLNVPFVVDGFLLKGRVDGTEALHDLLVQITDPHGESSSINVHTNADGVFEVANMKPQTYVVKVVGSGVHFEDVTLDITGPKFTIPPIRPSRYLLSGRVERDRINNGELRIKLESKGASIGNVLVSDNGTFSIFLPPGKITASVEVSTEDRRKGRGGFSPVEYTVDIIDRPISNIDFVPIQVSLSGTVETDNGIETVVVLTENDVNEVLKTNVMDGKFSFDQILPGTYRLSIDEDERCWEDVSKDILLNEDTKNIRFVQKGYFVSMESSNPVNLMVGEQQSIPLIAGNNRVCLGGDQMIQLSVSSDSCSQFDIIPPKIDPTRNKVVVLSAKSHKVSGTISSDSVITDLSVHLSKDDVENVSVVKVSDNVYEFSFNAVSGNQYTVTPKASEHLFHPTYLHLSMGNECLLNSMVFTARDGVFIRGSVNPKLKDVKVSIDDKLWGLTNDDGNYQIGPIPEDDEEYTLKAELKGYLFTEVSDGNFVGRKLASVTVRISEGPTPLSAVVVSLSGGENYRRNAITKEGVVEFIMLEPGDYFVKPMLKEYEFTPKSDLITVEQGDSINFEIKAKRTAFSLYGKVVSLNEDAETGVPIIAESTQSNCMTEEAVSESSGEFRVRGLKPDCTYQIRLHKSIISSIETVLPEVTSVKVHHEDVKERLQLVAIRKFEIMDLAVLVAPSGGVAPLSIKVTFESVNDNSLHHTVKAIEGHMIVLPSVSLNPKNSYSIRVESVNDKYVGRKTAQAHFTANETYKFFSLTLKESTLEKSVTTKSSGYMSWLLWPLLFMLACWFLYRNDSHSFILEILDKRFRGDGAEATDNGKRRSKPRK